MKKPPLAKKHLRILRKLDPEEREWLFREVFRAVGKLDEHTVAWGKSGRGFAKTNLLQKDEVLAEVKKIIAP